MLDVGCWMLDVGCWMLDVRLQIWNVVLDFKAHSIFGFELKMARALFSLSANRPLVL